MPKSSACARGIHSFLRHIEALPNDGAIKASHEGVGVLR